MTALNAIETQTFRPMILVFFSAKHRKYNKLKHG